MKYGERSLVFGKSSLTVGTLYKNFGEHQVEYG